MGSYRRPCIILVWKFQTSQMLEKWSRTSKLSHIKLYHYPDSQYIFSTCTRTHLSTIPIKPVFDIFKSFSVFIILSIGWHVNFADLGVRLRLSTFRIIFLRFLRTGISPDFTWTFFTRFLGGRGWFQVYFLLGLRNKKNQRNPAKNVRSNSVRIVISYSLSRENAIFATPKTPLEKSNDLHKLMSLEDFPWGTCSGRQFFGFDPWLSFLLRWYLSLKFWVKRLLNRRSILRTFHIVYFVHHSFF